MNKMTATASPNTSTNQGTVSRFFPRKNTTDYPLETFKEMYSVLLERILDLDTKLVSLGISYKFKALTFGIHEHASEFDILRVRRKLRKYMTANYPDVCYKCYVDNPDYFKLDDELEAEEEEEEAEAEDKETPVQKKQKQEEGEGEEEEEEMVYY